MHEDSFTFLIIIPDVKHVRRKFGSTSVYQKVDEHFVSLLGAVEGRGHPPVGDKIPK